MEELCAGLPKQIEKYLIYVRNLSFEQNPDYDWIRKNFKDLLTSRGHTEDVMFDWLCKKLEIPFDLKDYADYKPEEEKEDQNNNKKKNSFNTRKLKRKISYSPAEMRKTQEDVFKAANIKGAEKVKK